MNPLKTLIVIPAAILWTCFFLAMNADAVPETTLFDFHSASKEPGWQVVNDDVMGGVSASRFQVSTNGCAIFSGNVSLENNGGFASVRSGPVGGDLRGLGVLIIRVRGDGQRYKCSVRTGSGFDAPFYQCSFLTKRDEWEEHRLAFKDFVPTYRGRVLTSVPPLDPAKIASVGFLIADKQSGPFRLEIGWIKAAPAQP